MKFFSLQIGFLKDEFVVKPLNSEIDFYSLFKGKRTFAPEPFTQSGGKIRYDIIGTGFSGLYLISDRIVSVLRSNGITGWMDFPVSIFDKQNNSVKGYFGFSVIGSCGSLDDSKQIKVVRENKDGMKYEIRKGLYFDPSSWDKTDIFSPDLKMFIFVTEQVKNLLENFENLNFKEISEIEMLVY